jgi:peptide deformylase
MAVLPIVKYPDPRLRQPTVPVGEVTDEVRQLVHDMADTMYAFHGAGIAAIQVGAPQRIFVIEPTVAGLTHDDDPVAFLDPEITWLSKETEVSDEGCLSFPGVHVQLGRARQAKVRARNLDGQWFEMEGTGLFARALQHEQDHLNGRLLIDLVSALKRKFIQRKMERAAANDDYDEPEAELPPSGRRASDAP